MPRSSRICSTTRVAVLRTPRSRSGSTSNRGAAPPARRSPAPVVPPTSPAGVHAGARGYCGPAIASRCASRIANRVRSISRCGSLATALSRPQPLARRRHRLVGAVQQRPYRTEQGRRVRPALLVARACDASLSFSSACRNGRRGLLGHLLQVLPAGRGEPPPQLAEHRLDRTRTGGECLRAGPQATPAAGRSPPPARAAARPRPGRPPPRAAPGRRAAASPARRAGRLPGSAWSARAPAPPAGPRDRPPSDRQPVPRRARCSPKAAPVAPAPRPARAGPAASRPCPAAARALDANRSSSPLTRTSSSLARVSSRDAHGRPRRPPDRPGPDRARRRR